MNYYNVMHTSVSELSMAGVGLCVHLHGSVAGLVNMIATVYHMVDTVWHMVE